jgi:hypothetical protein
MHPLLLHRHQLMFRLRGCYPLCRAFRMPFDYINDFLLPVGFILFYMKFTTCLRLHSQATRLVENISYGKDMMATRDFHPL